MGDVVFELRGITKRFPGVVANDAVDFDLRQGEVHALLGENGAGKTTLMNILSGLQRPDSGQILLGGRPVRIDSPRSAIGHGIGMVHQHFMLIPVMTVTENIVLAQEPRSGPLLDTSAASARVRDLSSRYGLAVEPHKVVEDISVSQQQRVEILKALYREAQILIFDEPTAVLTPQESRDLFRIVRRFTDAGKSVVFISHKLREVMEIADRITVLRRGRRVATIDRSEADEAGLAKLMVGRDVLLRVDKAPARPGETLLSVEDLWVTDDRGTDRVRGVTFNVRAGEVVGVAGVDGNGQSELVDALTGLRRPASGSIRIEDREVAGSNPRAFSNARVGHIPEDRRRRGLVLDFSLAENLSMRSYRQPPDSRRGWLNPRSFARRASRLIREFDIRGGGPATLARALSGGNQQKVVVAREVARNPRVLIAAQPTRGLDVGAIEALHRRLIEERDAGRAILLVSFELDEILSLCDRIVVLYEGRIVAEYLPGVSEQTLGIAMTGGKIAAVAPG